MPNIYFYLGSIMLFSMLGFTYLGYKKIFGGKNYKILKDYKYKNSRIQLIVNPTHNICGNCFDILEEQSEITRFPKCDHHFCQKCIHKLIDESHSNLSNPCKLCFNV